MGSSEALQKWKGERAAALDEFMTVHARVSGTGPGRRHLTEQLNRGYLLAVCAEFQGFCRDLHSEAVFAIVNVLPTPVQVVVAENLSHGRFLDKGNPRAGALGSDFGRLGVELWAEVGTRLADGKGRNARLEQIIDLAQLDRSCGTDVRGRPCQGWDVAANSPPCEGMA